MTLLTERPHTKSKSNPDPLGAVGDWDAAREADLETGLVEVGPMQGKALGHPLQIESRFKKVLLVP